MNLIANFQQIQDISREYHTWDRASPQQKHKIRGNAGNNSYATHINYVFDRADDVAEVFSGFRAASPAVNDTLIALSGPV